MSKWLSKQQIFFMHKIVCGHIVSSRVDNIIKFMYFFRLFSPVRPLFSVFHVIWILLRWKWEWFFFLLGTWYEWKRKCPFGCIWINLKKWKKKVKFIALRQGFITDCIERYVARSSHCMWLFSSCSSIYIFLCHLRTRSMS